MIKPFKLSDVILTDDYFTQITQKDVDFLNTFDVDRLLYNFRLTAGLPNKASGPYSGWENTRIGGHTLGHYLAAAAQACAGGYGEYKGRDGISLRERVAALIYGLAECQEAGKNRGAASGGEENPCKAGFIFGATMEDPSKPELQFDKLEAGTPADTWVPWYTMHKIMNGLVEVAKLCDNCVGDDMCLSDGVTNSVKAEAANPDNSVGVRALVVAENLGEWIYRRTSSWTEEELSRVLSVEYGAMNDCLYELYKCAKAAGYKDAKHFMKAAHAFDEEKLFEEVLTASWDKSGHITDILNNKHANCTIPKFVGAINRCVTLMEEGLDGTAEEQKLYLEYCKAFWTLVTERHSYITGGNSECEHFGRDNILDAERSNCNCETCNTHNMLKLTRSLFMLTGEKKYADYYENTFINSILASVNRESGMTTYFQPMATGCFKTYCNPDVNKNYFWCCTGTGLENFTKLGDSIYFHDDENALLFVNQYVSSSVKWKCYCAKENTYSKVVISQKSWLPADGKVELSVGSVDLDGTEASWATKDTGIVSFGFTLALRLPDWATETLEGQPEIFVNGGKIECEPTGGYIFLKRKWQNGDKVELNLPMEIKAFNLPDNQRSYAFKYGPVVLAAELGRDSKMTLRQVGVQCDVCANKIVRGLELPLNGNYGGTSGLKPLAAETLLVEAGDKGSLESFMKNIERHFKKTKADRNPEGTGYNAENLSFILHDTNWPGEFKFSPYYLINNQRYGIYWLFTDSPDEIKMLNAIAENQAHNSSNYIEGIGVGYGTQTEGNASTWPFMEEGGTGSLADPHALWRYAKAGGSFSYMFKVLPDEDKTIYLDCTFLAEDAGKAIRITSGDILIAEYTVTVSEIDSTIEEDSEKITKSFELPKQLTNGRKELRIHFAGENGMASARLVAPVSTSWK